MDPTILVVSIIGAVLTTGLIYYSLRTVFLFKSNVAARAWVYISLSAIFFGVGVTAFLIESLVPLGLLPVGGVLETVGALFLLLGLRRTSFSGLAKIISLNQSSPIRHSVVMYRPFWGGAGNFYQKVDSTNINGRRAFFT